MNTTTTLTTAEANGRLSRPPDPVLFELLYAPSFESDMVEFLPHLLRIDAAHLLMLARTGILPVTTVGELLAVNRELQDQLRSGAEVFVPPPAHRGLYLLYEQRYIERLGAEHGGAAHVARSRNDINATVFRRRLRLAVLEQIEVLSGMVGALVERAAAEADTLMSGFTHCQPAQPVTFGHYLGGVAAALLRPVEDLSGAWPGINRSPMGSAAGFGTAFPIDPALVAHLLGFDGVVASSLDAVASRDDAVRVLGSAALFGVTLTRLASDLQHWGSYAYSFLSWPDDLVSTSSIMPQKRNAFVLENIRGQAVHPVGALTNALVGMKNTPFTNGVEAGSEAPAPIWSALRSSTKAARLMTLLIERMATSPGAMRDFLRPTGSTMTALADALVARQGLAFRTAHDVVGRVVARLAEASGTPTFRELRRTLGSVLEELAGQSLIFDEDDLRRILDASRCAAAARYGGGPSPDTVRAQLRDLEERLAALHDRSARRRRRLEAAENELDDAMHAMAREAQERGA